MSDIKTETQESEWIQENLLKLLAAMKANITESERKHKYTEGMKTLDWKKVAFPPFSPEACQEKFSHILDKVGKLRTLTELINEAEEVISNPIYSPRIHPEYPKKPSPSNAIYYEKNRAKLQKLHPELNSSMLFKLAVRKFKTLPQKEKAHYVKKSTLASKEYCKKRQQFWVEFVREEEEEEVSADTTDTEECSERADSRSLGWTKANLQKLLAAMKANISKNERSLKYDKGMNMLDWKQVAFHPFSPEACRQKWDEILNKMRKSRSLKELIDEVEVISHLTSNPRLSEDRHEATGALPSPPPLTGYNLFCKEQLRKPGIEIKYLMSVWAQRWRDLSKTQKSEYSARCKEMKRKYTLKMQEYAKDRRHNVRQKKLPGEPKMPSFAGNVAFVQNQMEPLKKEMPSSRTHFVKANKMGSKRSRKKERYKKWVEEKKMQYLVALQAWFETLSPKEQKNYLKCNPAKCHYLKAKQMKACDRQKQSLPSDSEDEDLEDSSSESSETENYLDLNEIEDEEEEEDVMMFDVY